MKKQNYRLRTIVIGLLLFVVIVCMVILGVPTKGTKLKVYRLSNNESNNCTINLYNDYVTSLKCVSIEPYAWDTQYVIDFKEPYSKISVSVYNSLRKEWVEKDIIELGNNQYSIDPELLAYYDHDYTVTYCINSENGDDIQKYYFTVKWNGIKSS